MSVGQGDEQQVVERGVQQTSPVWWSEEEEEREAQAMQMLGCRSIVGIKTEAANTGKTRRATTTTRQKEIPTQVLVQ